MIGMVLGAMMSLIGVASPTSGGEREFGQGQVGSVDTCSIFQDWSDLFSQNREGTASMPRGIVSRCKIGYTEDQHQIFSYSGTFSRRDHCMFALDRSLIGIFDNNLTAITRKDSDRFRIF